MLVSCRYCNGLHIRGKTCINKPNRTNYKKDETYIRRFRSSNAWQKKREEIKKRDKYLCQWCLLEGKYIFSKLSVHHIYPLTKYWTKRLDNCNLITLCPSCHILGDNGELEKNILKKIARKNSALS